MDTAVEMKTITREILIDATPETIWQLLVDPGEAVRWMGTAAMFDLRRGGVYRVDIIPGSVAAGKFVEIDPPRRLVYTWGWEGNADLPPGSTTVSFELEPRGKKTLLRLEHRDLPSADSAERHAHGWIHYMERLAAAASGKDPGTDPWIANGPCA